MKGRAGTIRKRSSTVYPMAKMGIPLVCNLHSFPPKTTNVSISLWPQAQSQGSRSSHLNLNEDPWIRFLEYSSSDDEDFEPKGQQTHLISQVQLKQNNKSSVTDSHRVGLWVLNNENYPWTKKIIPLLGFLLYCVI